MSIIQTQSFNPVFTGSSFTVSLPSTPTLGNSVFIVFTSQGYPFNVASITDNQTPSNTYSIVNQAVGPANTAGIMWCPSVLYASGTFTVTINTTTSGTCNTGDIVGVLMEVSGLNGVIDRSNTGTPTTNTSAAITNSAANQYQGSFVLACLATEYAGSVTQTPTGPSNGYTSLYAVTGGASGVLKVGCYNFDSGTPTDTTTYSWPNTAPAAWAIASFQQATPLNNLSFAYSPQSVAFGRAGATTLALSPLSFSYSLKTNTLASGATLAAANLSFAYNIQNTIFVFSEAAFELLGAPLHFFTTLGLSQSAFQIDNAPIAFTWTPNSVTLTVYGGKNPMPNCVGLLLFEALQLLQTVGILNPSALGYFGTYPISANWVSGFPRGTVVAQSVPAGFSVAVNSPITLTVTEYKPAVVFP